MTHEHKKSEIVRSLWRQCGWLCDR